MNRPIEERFAELDVLLDELISASFESGYQSVYSSDIQHHEKVDMLLTKARAEAIALAVGIK